MLLILMVVFTIVMAIAATVLLNPLIPFEQRIVGAGIVVAVIVILLGGTLTCTIGRMKMQARR